MEGRLRSTPISTADVPQGRSTPGKGVARLVEPIAFSVASGRIDRNSKLGDISMALTMTEFCVRTVSDTL